jgi:hypothetical protein
MLRLFALMLCIVGLTGCQHAPPVNFSVANVGPSKTKLDADVKSITVTIANAGEAVGDLSPLTGATTTLWQSSLQDALTRMAIFRDESPRKVSLVVKILQFDVPSRAVTFTTGTTARYQLLDRSNGSVIYTRDISSNSAVSMDYAMLGATRAIESINRSVQDNITQFLQTLETVDLDHPMAPPSLPPRTSESPTAHMSARGVAMLPNEPVANGVRSDRKAPSRFDDPIGAEYRDMMLIGSVQVPLPEGVWVLAGNGGPSSEYALSLVRIEGGKLAGIIRVWTAARPVSNGYTAFGTCNRTDILFATVQSNVERGDQDCWAINHYDMQHARATSTQQHMLDSYSFLDSRNIGVPDNMIVGIHRIATRTNFITIWYHINPELAGFAAPTKPIWDQSDWHRGRLALDPKRVAYIEAFKQQQAQYQDLLRRGFSHDLVSSAASEVR